MLKKPISIQLYTVREVIQERDAVSVLQEIADIGYKGVEGFGYGYTPPDFRKIVEDMGMVVSSYFGPVPTPENTSEVIDTALQLGVNQFVTGFWIPTFESRDSILAAAEGLNQALPHFQKAGLDLCLHNHWFEYEMLDGKYKMQHLLDAAPGVKLEIDVYWAASFGVNDPAAIVDQYKSMCPLLHVKDGPLVQGEPHTAVGSGKMDIPRTLAAADPKVTQWHVVELDECATDMMQAVAESYKYLVGNDLSEGNKPA